MPRPGCRLGGASRPPDPWSFGDTHRLAQGEASARQTGAHRADRHPQHGGRIGVGQAFKADQQDDRPLFLGELAERAVELRQGQRAFGSGFAAGSSRRSAGGTDCPADRAGGSTARPGSWLSPPAVKLIGQRLANGVLDQLDGLVGVARQGRRVADQLRELLLRAADENRTPDPSPLSTAWRRVDGRSLRIDCKRRMYGGCSFGKEL